MPVKPTSAWDGAVVAAAGQSDVLHAATSTGPSRIRSCARPDSRVLSGVSESVTSPAHAWRVWPLALVNVASAAAWAMIAMAFRRGRFALATLGAMVEVLVHAWFVIVFLGWGFGAQYYLLFLLLCTFFLPFRQLATVVTAGTVRRQRRPGVRDLRSDRQLPSAGDQTRRAGARTQRAAAAERAAGAHSSAAQGSPGRHRCPDGWSGHRGRRGRRQRPPPLLRLGADARGRRNHALAA